MTERRRLTTLDKLKIVTEQARCPLCGNKLGDLSGLDFDHEHALTLGGTDTLDNLRAVHRKCHDIKTNGRGGERRISTLDSDTHTAAHTRRLTERQEEFRRNLLRKEAGEPKPASAWPKRKLQSRNDLAGRRP